MAQLKPQYNVSMGQQYTRNPLRKFRWAIEFVDSTDSKETAIKWYVKTFARPSIDFEETPLDFRHVGCEAPVHVDIVCDERHRVSVDEVHVTRPDRGSRAADQISPRATASRKVR